MLIGLGGPSDESGVVGDGDRDVAAVAEDEDMVKKREITRRRRGR